MRGRRALSQVGLLHGLAFQGGCDRAIHHQLGEMRGCLVEIVDGFADGLIIFALLYDIQRFLQLRDAALLLGFELRPRRTATALPERRNDRFRLVARFDDLALAEIFLGIVERLEQHALDLLIGEPVAGLHFDFGFLPAALFPRRDMQNAVRVDQEPHLDARHARSHRWHALQIETRQRPAILGQFAFPLQNMNRDIRLPVDLRRIELRGGSGNRRIPQNDFVGHPAGDFDAERQWRHVEQ